MNRQTLFSYVLVSVMAMTLALPLSAWADGGGVLGYALGNIYPVPQH